MNIENWAEKNAKYILTLPAVIFVLAMVVFPLAYTLMVSFQEWNLTTYAGRHWNGLRNYGKLLTDERFWNATARTLVYSFAALAVEAILGIAVAVFLNREFKGKDVTKTLFLLPMVSTPVAVGMVWLFLYEPTMGLANYFLSSLGIPPQPWLTSGKTVLPSLILIDVWQWTPIIMLITLAGLATLPKEPYDSAKIDGASDFQIFTKITLPLVMPTVLIGLLIRLIDALKTYDIIYATTQGGPGEASETLNILGYVLGFSYFQMGMGSALIVLFLVIVTIVSLAFMRLRQRTINALY
jgi:multiple sugar transport system permease protein